jgi:hypothetical protein
MQKQIEYVAQIIKQLSDSLRSEQETLRKFIKEYEIKRIEFFKEELRARGLTWCTICAEKKIFDSPEVIPECDVELILLEGREMYSCGYENSCYGYRDFFDLHRACLKCREEAFDKHGIHGSYNKLAHDQEYFNAFRVEKRNDGYYARKFGNWVKLDDEKCKFPRPPYQLVNRLTEEWDLPPRIELDRDDKLVICEPVAQK